MSSKCKDSYVRHTNNKGYRQIKNGKTSRDLKFIAKKLKIPFKTSKAI